MEWTPVPVNGAVAAPWPMPVQLDPDRPMTVILHPTSACASVLPQLPVAWFNA